MEVNKRPLEHALKNDQNQGKGQREEFSGFWILENLWRTMLEAG